MPNFGTTFVTEEAVYNMSFRSNKAEANYLRSGLQKHLNKLEYMVTILPQKKIKNGWI
ncbi:hypothetical protein QGU_0964 [Clostridioides difficile 655]|uniref:hypothetical protein n=1 Tax=Clostridioides difficile TaxID=1496 RepID=UPI00038D2539|nr:hypothetical protein [Clostridioides difficile]EQF90069.1 hypothetical protein QGU_0964 [Clostridioides difficile 655]